MGFETVVGLGFELWVTKMGWEGLDREIGLDVGFGITLEMGLGCGFEVGLGFGLWVKIMGWEDMDIGSTIGLAETRWLVEVGLVWRVWSGLAGIMGLWGRLLEEPTSKTLDQLTSHLPLGPRNSLSWRSTTKSPSVPSEAAIGSFRPITSFSFPRQQLRETKSWETGFAELWLPKFK